ncbi:MAG: hypothetical protein ACJASV_001577 [Pseudorhodobacter sp.]|jgi:hypothetical protein
MSLAAWPAVAPNGRNRQIGGKGKQTRPTLLVLILKGFAAFGLDRLQTELARFDVFRRRGHIGRAGAR